MALTGPPPISFNPVLRVINDLRTERATKLPYPPGDTAFSVRRTRRMLRNPLDVLLPAYEHYGPVFSLRVMHDRMIWLLGPEANHYMTVSHASNFTWRDGFMGDLIPLLGDGLLTIDGDFHRRSRRIMVPAFHSERIAATHATMLAEIDRGLDGWHDGTLLDLHAWSRKVTLRIAMRALFGLDPDATHAQVEPARRFEEALGFYGREYVMQMVRGPASPWRRMMRARAQLDEVIFTEVTRRRATGERGEDVLSLLLDAEDEDGSSLTDQQIRDEVMTLLFAGHDTTTATIAFLFYELARSPDVGLELIAEQQRVIGDRAPTPAELMGGALPALDRAIEETLRLYPPAWIGGRRAVEPFELAGVTVPGGVRVNYSSWASHRLPDVWERPHDFVPARWTPEFRAQLPKGAYVPFGAGSRICIGMRFGELEIRTAVSRILSRFELDLVAGYELRIRQMPTIGPRGLPMVVRSRRTAAAQPEPVAA
jgi:cytochrome P450